MDKFLCAGIARHVPDIYHASAVPEHHLSLFRVDLVGPHWFLAGVAPKVSRVDEGLH